MNPTLIMELEFRNVHRTPKEAIQIIWDIRTYVTKILRNLQILSYSIPHSLSLLQIIGLNSLPLILRPWDISRSISCSKGVLSISSTLDYPIYNVQAKLEI